MIHSIISLAIEGILPTLLTLVFIVINKHTKFNKINYYVRQVIYGICFGGLAVLGTEWGIPLNGAQLNVRDASVLSAGLLFGPTAGIIAGLIGGIERYVAVNWGVGTYTQIACTISTIVAGLYSAVLRKHMFEDKKPGWTLALACGLVMETFHITMVFITNMNDTTTAMSVVKACAIPMILANTLSITLSTVTSILMTSGRKRAKSKPRISQTVQRWLLACVAFAFVVSSIFVYSLQNSIAESEAANLLLLAIADVENDVVAASDRNLLSVTKRVSQDIKTMTLTEICEKEGITEINLVNSNGIVYNSSISSNVGFNMNNAESTKDFMKLLSDETEWVSYDEKTLRKYAGIRTIGGFVQVAVDDKYLRNDIIEEIKGKTENRHVGQTGYIIIADSDKNVVSAPLNDTHKHLSEYGLDYVEEPLEAYKASVGGVDCHIMYDYNEGYYIISALPLSESYNNRDIVIYANTFMEILVFGLMFGLIYIVIKKVIVNNLNKINDSLAKITNGNLEEKVEVSSNYEFVSLSDDINKTVDTLKKYIAEASEKIKEELRYAENIQKSSLPHTFPEDERMQIYALMDPAKEVGGDFYDVFKTKDNTMHFLIADVSGKGIPGAMFMMRAKSVLHSLTENINDVNQVFTDANNSLCSGNDAGMFVTAWQGCIDLDTGLVTYACAGHNPPVIKHADGHCEYVKGKAGFVLAGMEGVQYKAQQIQMEPGDVLFLYTDGVTEATNINKELYGEERLLAAMTDVPTDLGMEYLTCEIIGNVGRFVDTAEQFDDITMVALKYLGK